ncbi:enoyl-CoA hydratase/isomerase family protein [Sphingomonas sp. BIUV-7]|uniref:3-hydroxyisobutyryl-CoA hydrolase n=1 Tax=Sphingomonas natans TaxID=3063330 RepID=A0ABT8YB97_9SPHN|nr:enoyl-CoA hydratase/isomerase family protein [Sphingomonas sp. BIUV-7]MDO6415108.1 enoyl-CoA hydratase/isomerase family protein [Sphingomonas sp. BIUV-7]
MTDELIVMREGAVGRLRLNRPRAIHALTLPMCEAMIAALLEWRTDPAVELVLLDHAEGRGFCAGGDVRAAAESGRGDGAAARAFFHTEYQLNHLLFTYAKPIVSVLDGIVMGGGVGIGLPARHRIATERTMFAMPETTIGLFPDVGAGWYLSRLPGRIGQYLALTGARLTGADCLTLGLATHYLQSDRVEEAKQQLLARPSAEAPAILERLSGQPDEPTILTFRDDIDRLFASDDFEEVLAVLTADGSDWARQQMAILATKSPQACKVSLELLAQGAAQTDFAGEMMVEYRVASRVCQRHDFLEGVRALLIDKDNAPRWDPATPDGVTGHLIDQIFAPLPDEEWSPAY